MAATDGTILIDVVLNEKEFKASLENMGETVRTGADRMIKSIGGLSGSFVLLPETITSVVNTVPGIIDSVIKTISGQNSAMTKTGTDFFTSLVSDLPNITSAVTNGVSGISEASVKRFAEFIPDMRTAGANLFTSLTADLQSITSTVTNGVWDISEAALDKFAEFIPDMRVTGRNLFTSVVSDISGIIRDITDVVPDITDAINDKIGGGERSVANAGYCLFTSLTARLPRAIREITKAPGEIVSALVETFDGFTDRFITVGENIVRGVWDGISAMGSWLSDKVTGFFDGIVGSVTKFLGISSPSKLFSDLVGKNIALGVQAGIDGEMDGVINSAKMQMSRLAGAAAQSAGFDFAAADVITRSGRGGWQSALDSTGRLPSSPAQNAGNPAIPEINIILEPSGDMRGFFDYIRMGVKRSAYLSGEV